MCQGGHKYQLCKLVREFYQPATTTRLPLDIEPTVGHHGTSDHLLAVKISPDKPGHDAIATSPPVSHGTLLQSGVRIGWVERGADLHGNAAGTRPTTQDVTIYKLIA